MDDAPNTAKFEVERPGARPAEPVAAEEGRLRPGDAAARAFTLIAQSALTQIAANGSVLREARRLEAVHQLRVGIRRLRGALSLFSPMLAGDGLIQVTAELKWLTGELNDARDLDVFIAESFRPAARRHREWTGMAALGKALLAAQTKAYDRAQTAARSARFGVAMLETTAWVESGDWTQDADPARAASRTRPIGELAAELLDDCRRKVIKRGRKLDSLSPDARHDLRLRAKKLRYATAFFEPLYVGHAPKAHKRFDKAMRDLQTALGEQTDITTAAALAADIALAGADSTLSAGPAQPLVAFAAGLVAAHRAEGERAAKKASLKAYQRFEAAEPFW
jgi:CHAD domain-containing protein